MPVAISADELIQEELGSQYARASTGSERNLERIASMAAQVFAAPLSVIRLTDRTVGHSFDDRAFSACALQQKEPLIVLDPLGDVRFRNHPVVTGKPSIRFYVAARLVGRNGRVLGTLSIADTKVRLYVLTAQRVALKDLAAIAVFELEHGSRSY